ncbi:MAG: Regulator of nucleoside diphosphate kinase [Pseudomonadales bacterium]|nr:Regulator of nucleoside diphosphate kinase [Pseudomonadales bacterium]
MPTPPPITVSSLDLERIERCLNTDAARHLPGMDALQAELDRATVVDPQQMPPDIVTMNSTVRFTDDSSGRQYELTLVYPDGAGQPGTVSVLAPIGSALLGLAVGQSIAWQVPGGRAITLRVLELLRQPEAMGEYHR